MASDTKSLPRVSVEHIVLDETGRARLAGHRIKVQHIVTVKQAQGYTPEQLQAEAYPHLSLAQIHAALAYYYDHQEEVDRQIAEEDAFDELQQQKQKNDPQLQERIAKMKARWQQLHGR